MGKKEKKSSKYCVPCCRRPTGRWRFAVQLFPGFIFLEYVEALYLDGCIFSHVALFFVFMLCLLCIIACIQEGRVVVVEQGLVFARYEAFFEIVVGRRKNEVVVAVAFTQQIALTTDSAFR